MFLLRSPSSRTDNLGLWGFVQNMRSIYNYWGELVRGFYKFERCNSCCIFKDSHGFVMSVGARLNYCFGPIFSLVLLV